MSTQLENSALQNSSEVVDNTIEPVLDENSNRWQNFNITKPNDHSNACERGFRDLLKNSKISIFGDICVRVRDDKYILDRAILASKSKFFKNSLENHDEEMCIEEYLLEDDKDNFLSIVDFIYGRTDLKSMIKEDNFFSLLLDMEEMDIEVDLEVFKRFIDETIVPNKAQLNEDLFQLYDYSVNLGGPFNYLLPTLSQYLSDRLWSISKQRRFLFLSLLGLVCILMNKGCSEEKDSITETIRICAEWICFSFKYRIKHLRDLTNAIKYRFELIPYCDEDPDLIVKLLKERNVPNESTSSVKEVEKYFNELLFFHGKAKFVPASNLKAELCDLKPGLRLVNSIDQATEWTSILKQELYCDVAIDVQGTIFKLHRVKLSSVSEYFYDLFTKSSKSTTASEADDAEKSKNPIKMQFSLDQMDPATFDSIIRYIYKEELEITSQTQLIDLLKGSAFLKMDELFKNCSSKMLEMVPNITAEIFELFQFVCEKDKFSELYNAVVKRIVCFWPKLDEHPHFSGISLDVLKEIVALPDLKIDNVDEILDLCSSWIFHDIENRYQCTIDLAKAVNRNIAMDKAKFKLKIPSNSNEYSQQYVKEQLTRILSSAALVSMKYDGSSNAERKPCFILSSRLNNTLSIADVNFNEIVQLAEIDDKAEWHCSATMIDDELFILFNIDDRFYFQLYDVLSNQLIVLATDARMGLCAKDSFRGYVILNCNNEIYFCVNKTILRYSVKLNRWITYSYFGAGAGARGCSRIYTSDGKNLYMIFPVLDKENKTTLHKVNFYDFEQKMWIRLPNIPIHGEKIQDTDGKIIRKDYPIKASIINQDLSVLFKSKTFSFNWISQTWISIDNSCDNFIEFTGQGKNILYVSNSDKEVHSFLPTQSEWKFVQKLPADLDRVISIHVINK